MIKPQRLQLSRRKGFDLQAASREANGLEAVNVARPSTWGNPFTVADMGSQEDAAARFRAAVIGPILDGKQCPTNAHPDSYIGRIIADAPKMLRGKNLACWCEPGEPCHADVLLELANAPTCEAVEKEPA